MWKTILLGVAITLGIAISWIWVGNTQFDRRVKAQITELLDQGRTSAHIIAVEDLGTLPEPVQRWLTASGILGRTIPRTIRLRQEGALRLGPDKAWMPFAAEQYYTVTPPAFLWSVSATATPAVFIRGVDALQNGEGSMKMAVYGTFNVVDEAGPFMDQGASLRYLQEMVWFPAAALSDAVCWEAVDSSSAQATLSLPTGEVTGTFVFDEAGHVVSFSALRYRDGIGMELWQTPMREHQMMGGIWVPTEGEGIWGDGDDAFTYIRVRLTDLEWDANSPYP